MKVGFQIPVQRHLEVYCHGLMDGATFHRSVKKSRRIDCGTTQPILVPKYKERREAKARLHDPLSCIPLTSGASSRKLAFAFFAITFCIFIEILVGIGIHGDQFVQ